jgi:serine/threonine protein kinase
LVFSWWLLQVKVGTTLYQAPEIVRKAKHGAPVDWWALGVLLVQMLTGETPFAEAGGDGAAGGAGGVGGDVDETVIESNILSHTGGVPARSAAAVPAGASELVAGLLTPNPAFRLGSSGGASQVRHTDWLRDIDWAALEARTLPVQHLPPPLSEDVDQALVELCKRCQSGFD